MLHLGDITKLDGRKLPPVDVVTGGSPCQDLSNAGKRAGLDGERSGLFVEQCRVIREMREKDVSEKLQSGRTDEPIRPRYMVWENVQGAFTSNEGKDFARVLTEIIRIVEPDAPDVPVPDKGRWPKAGFIHPEVGGGRWPGDYMTLNTGESPREERESHLSQILEETPPEKYYLSPKACQGILNRAAKKGYSLPPVLKETLEKQAGLS